MLLPLDELELPPDELLPPEGLEDEPDELEPELPPEGLLDVPPLVEGLLELPELLDELLPPEGLLEPPLVDGVLDGVVPLLLFWSGCCATVVVSGTVLFSTLTLFFCSSCGLLAILIISLSFVFNLTPPFPIVPVE